MERTARGERAMRPSPNLRRSTRPTAGPLAAALLVASAIAPYAARAQDAPPAGAAPAVERMDVIVVNVEVWVTDKDDIPIRGLTASDFEILEDGKPMPITNFSEIGAEPGSARSPYATSPAAPPGGPVPPAPQAEPDEPGQLVVYFDQLHVTPMGTRRLLNDLKSFLASGPTPPERVLILRQSFDLFTEAPFGSTRQELEAALARLSESATLGAADARFGLSRLQDAWAIAQERPNPCRDFAVSARSEIATHIAAVDRGATATIENLQRTAQLLAALPGHKTLIFVSDSLETRPGAELVRFASNLCGGERELAELSHMGDAAQLIRRLQDFAEEANRNRVTVYPFQPSGIQGPSMMGPEQGSVDFFASSGVDSLLRSVRRDGLVELARQTGGRTVFDRNRFDDDLLRLGTDMASYYSLGYSPGRTTATGNHIIDVRLRGTLAKNARLRHRLGYRDRESEDVLQERLEGALAFGAMRNPLGVRLAVGTLGKADKGKYGMPLHVLVPTTAITFFPQQSGERARLRVAIQASNPKTRKREKLEQSFSPGRPASAQTLDLRLLLRLPEGVHVVAVGVRDELTGESSVVATTVAIEDPATGTAPGGH
jgi:VWFA-related protein